ncbi:MAG TPA: NAD(P)-dependent alcohol dehydrogenase [Actinomycetota bacterium]|nr:NAD(P)-dependent alcohol dehydrogenase [Actinomycetota bacterium]
MKAAVHTRYGPPDVVRIAEVDRPKAGVHEVLVEVHATTVNRTDCGFRAAHPWFVRFFSGLLRPKVSILGTEFAGVVDAVGSDVTSFQAGDRVFGFSEDRWGAHAEYLAMPEDGPLAIMPASATFEEVAPSTEGAHYALSLITRAQVRSGQHVLVNGATGAIGSAAVQLLKRLGAIVTAVCATEHVELVRSLGADRVIDRRAEDFTKDDQRYDVVLDAVGKSSFGRCKRLLMPRGIYLSTDLGPLSQNPILALITPLFGGRRVMFPIPPKHSQAEVRQMKEMIEAGEFMPVIDRHYPLDQIVEAYRYVEMGQKVGNVVITVEPAT